MLIYAAPKIPRRFAPPKLIHFRPVYFFSDERLVFGENLQTLFPPLQRPTSKISSRSLESAPFQLHGTWMFDSFEYSSELKSNFIHFDWACHFFWLQNDRNSFSWNSSRSKQMDGPFHQFHSQKRGKRNIKCRRRASNDDGRQLRLFPRKRITKTKQTRNGGKTKIIFQKKQSVFPRLARSTHRIPAAARRRRSTPSVGASCNYASHKLICIFVRHTSRLECN